MERKRKEDGATSIPGLFTIDKTRWGTLCDQIADGFRNAIASGLYKPGDTLPGMRALSVHFGVSLRVVVRAFAKLVAEQLVAGRPGVGCRVLAPRTSLWKGMVLLIIPGGDYVYAVNMCAGRVSDRLSKEGYMVQRVTVPALGRKCYDFRYLDLLLRQSTSLVVMISVQSVIERHLAKMGVRYVVVGRCAVSQKCSGLIRLDARTADNDLVAHAQRAGIGTVAIVGSSYNINHVELVNSFKGSGIVVDEWKISTRVHVSGRLDAIQTKTRDFFRKRLGEGVKLPDLLVFVDEYRAMGGALALYEAGVDIPGDVRLVSLSNVGNGPVLRNGVARLEYDPFEQAEQIAGFLIQFLSTGNFPANAEIHSRYVPDETFPD